MRTGPPGRRDVYKRQIIGCGNNCTAPLLSNLFDGHGHSRAFADNDAVRAHFNGAKLGFIPVSQNHQIMGLDVKLHQIGIGRRDQHLSLIHILYLTAPSRFHSSHTPFVNARSISFLTAAS